MKDAVIIFDMDGVLVDVSESYRETIVRTVEHFTGRQITRERIQDYKNAGGWNNDFALSRKICVDLGVDVAYEDVAAYFTGLFLERGLIHRERWLPKHGLLDHLSQKFELAIFTGRSQIEAAVTLQREGCHERFFIVSSDDVVNQKPHPEGLLKIAALHPGKRLLYLGDTVDDARSARAANVPFIGVAGTEMPKRDELVRLLQMEGAIRVLENVNEIR